MQFDCSLITALDLLGVFSHRLISASVFSPISSEKGIYIATLPFIREVAGLFPTYLTTVSELTRFQSLLWLCLLRMNKSGQFKKNTDKETQTNRETKVFIRI